MVLFILMIVGFLAIFLLALSEAQFTTVSPTRPATGYFDDYDMWTSLHRK